MDADQSNEGPLQLEKHLNLREQLSHISRTSVLDIWKAAPTGERLSTLLGFLNARFGPGKLSSDEFLLFGFAEAASHRDNWAEFAGKQAQQAFNKVYNDRDWYAVTKHKLLFETVLKGADLPAPKTLAVFDRKGRGAGVPVLKSDEDLMHFLLDSANHPVFCKPTTGLLSIGAFQIDGCENETITVNGQHKYHVNDVIDYIKGISKKGYLFQSVLIPHPAFNAIGCDVIASIRFVVLNQESSAQIHSCALKLPANGEVADNFWRVGSLLCDIAIETGQVCRAVAKTDKGMKLLCNKEEASNIIGFTLPDFESARERVLEAARHFPGIKIQSWDVALTKCGPVLLEVNFGGDLNLSQMASGKGAMTEPYCEILRESGYSGFLPN
ncbi:MAG: sugar-transfer associated ATP-grasp domain-containing protein [Pseudomonadota bacterium]